MNSKHYCLYCRQEGLTDHVAQVDTDRLSQGISNVLAALKPRLKDFHNLLTSPPKVHKLSIFQNLYNIEQPYAFELDLIKFLRIYKFKFYLCII